MIVTKIYRVWWLSSCKISLKSAIESLLPICAILRIKCNTDSSNYFQQARGDYSCKDVKERVCAQGCLSDSLNFFGYFTVSFDHQWLILILYIKYRVKRTILYKVIAKNVFVNLALICHVEFKIFEFGYIIFSIGYPNKIRNFLKSTVTVVEFVFECRPPPRNFTIQASIVLMIMMYVFLCLCSLSWQPVSL